VLSGTALFFCRYSCQTRKTEQDLGGYFLHFKDDDADGLSPGKKEDAEMREMGRKDALLFLFDNYTFYYSENSIDNHRRICYILA